MLNKIYFNESVLSALRGPDEVHNLSIMRPGLNINHKDNEIWWIIYFTLFTGQDSLFNLYSEINHPR